MKSLLIFIYIFVFISAEDPKVQVKLMSPKHFRINQNDLERLKEEIAIDMRNKIQKLTSRWFINDKIREKQIGAWSQNPSQMNPYSFQNQQSMLFGSPQFREQLYSQVQNQLSDTEKNTDSTKVDDLETKVTKQNEEVNELKKQLNKLQNTKVESKKVDKDQRLSRFKQMNGQDGNNESDQDDNQKSDEDENQQSDKDENQKSDKGQSLKDLIMSNIADGKDASPYGNMNINNDPKNDDGLPFKDLLSSIGNMLNNSTESLKI